jgi:hypothetical protein
MLTKQLALRLAGSGSSGRRLPQQPDGGGSKL